MTQLNLEKALRNQLEVLNDIIDRKIVRGLPYTREAKQHKYILNRLSSLRKSRGGFFYKTFSLA